MMLGLLLARAGVGVTVLEKHADFLRDFRGATVHPSTLEILYELGVLEEFLRLPQSKVRSLSVQLCETTLTMPGFGHLQGRCQFPVLMSQCGFLNFLSHQPRSC